MSSSNVLSKAEERKRWVGWYLICGYLNLHLGYQHFKFQNTFCNKSVLLWDINCSQIHKEFFYLHRGKWRSFQNLRFWFTFWMSEIFHLKIVIKSIEFLHRGISWQTSKLNKHPKYYVIIEL